jgi:hypothetical protein
MRRAFIGLSSPICYDYGFDHVLDDHLQLPNPVLDSPMAIFLLYDELWFLNRHVCPMNCRELPFVRFVEDEYDLTKLDLRPFDLSLSQMEEALPGGYNAITWETYRKAVKDNLDYELEHRLETRGIDTSSRPFKIGNRLKHASADPRNLLIDDLIAREYGMQLITNSMTSGCLAALRKPERAKANELVLTQYLLCENVPNFQFKEGPYHALIADLRSDNLLENFRKRIQGVVARRPEESPAQLKKEMEDAMTRYLNELIIKTVDKKNIYVGVASAILGQIPVIGNVYGAFEGGAEVYERIKERTDVGWMAFIAKARLQRGVTPQA